MFLGESMKNPSAEVWQRGGRNWEWVPGIIAEPVEMPVSVRSFSARLKV